MGVILTEILAPGNVYDGNIGYAPTLCAMWPFGVILIFNFMGKYFYP